MNGMSDLSELIEQSSSSPKSVEVDGQRVTAQSLKDLIEADRYLASKAAANRPRRALRMTKLQPPGTQ